MPLSLRKILKYLSITLVTLLMLLAIAIGVLPSAMKWGIHAWLEQQQLNSEIDDIELQLFDGRLAIHNLRISNARQQKFKLASLVIRLDPSALFQRRIVVQQFKLHGLDLAIEQIQDKGLSLAGISLPVPVSSTTQAIPPTPIARPWQLTVEQIDLAQLRSCYHADVNTSQEICASLGKLKWNGHVKLDLQPTTSALLNSLQANVSLSLQGLELNDPKQKYILAAVKQLGLRNIYISGQAKVNIEAIELNRLFALQRPKTSADARSNYVLNAKSVRMDDISITNQSQLAVASLQMQGVNLVLQREARGRFEVSDLLARYQPLLSQPTPSDKEPPASTAGAAFNFKVGQLSLLDHSSLHFIDNNIKPASQLEFNDLQLSVQQIDSAQRNLRSPLKIDLRLGQYGEIHQQGNIMLFAERPTLKLEGQLKGINVADFNAYIEQAIQHYVKSGHLDATTAINIEQGQLDSTTQLTLHKFYVEPETEQASQEYQHQLGLPLGTALSLLRDRDNSISLKLPVSGDIKDPNFSISDVIGKVSSKALKSALINYYSPLGVLTLAGNLFDIATALRFAPITFDVSTALLDDDDRVQLNKLAQVMQERPQLHLVICGVSTQADRLAWYPAEFESSSTDEGETISVLPSLSKRQLQRLDQLAQQRSLVVQEYLLKEKNIDASRLILCTARHQPGDTQAPRTELQI